MLSRSSPLRPVVVAAALLALGACKLERYTRTDSTQVRQSGVRDGMPDAWDADRWSPPSIDEAPNDSLGASIRRGQAIMLRTPDSMPSYVGGNLKCTSCHLDAATRPNAATLGGVVARFPKYMDRSGAMVSIEDRVNYCFTRSLAGRRVPTDSREMHDIVAYLAFISRGVPIGEHVRGEGMPEMPKLRGDSARGRAQFSATCTRCHGVDGAGMGVVPAVWGAKSFSIGASMAREERAASFIRHNMPFDRPGTLSDQAAYDVAAYITSLPRPDSPGKAGDWPKGGAPSDVPYDTRGRTAFRHPRLLPRRIAGGGEVPPPRPAER